MIQRLDLNMKQHICNEFIKKSILLTRGTDSLERNLTERTLENTNERTYNILERSNEQCFMNQKSIDPRVKFAIVVIKKSTVYINYVIHAAATKTVLNS